MDQADVASVGNPVAGFVRAKSEHRHMLLIKHCTGWTEPKYSVCRVFVGMGLMMIDA